MSSSKNTVYRVLIKSDVVYYRVGKIVIQKNTGDFYYVPSQKGIVASSFGMLGRILDHFGFHPTGRVHVKTNDGERKVIESGLGEVEPRTTRLRQPVKEIGFQEILKDTIIDFRMIPILHGESDALDVVFDIGEYKGPVQFSFSIVSGRLITASFKGEKVGIRSMPEEIKRKVLAYDRRCLGVESDNADKLLQYILCEYEGDSDDLVTGRRVFIAADSRLRRD